MSDDPQSVNGAGSFQYGGNPKLGPESSSLAAWVQWGPGESVENAHDQGTPQEYTGSLNNNASGAPSAPPSANR